ncbi:MAG: THUMP domain-containing class I SAM-dependent RNA methyltransferase [Xenococcaceae cyanobacterium]
MNNYFATVAPGLESIAAKELENLGVKEIKPDVNGVHFQGDLSILYRVNLWARTVYRVLVTIAEVKAFNAEQLYRSVQQIDWNKYIFTEQTLAVNCTGGNRNLNHTHFTALQIKKAIVDLQRKNTGQRSNVDTNNPDILVNAHIYENRCFLSLDSSGSSLHRRGYRQAMGLAPLKESLAAALLEFAEWRPDLPFLDPLCGSGTLPIEAALKSLNIAPGLYRQSFGFQNWQNFDLSLWQEIVKEAKDSQKEQFSAPILGSDSDAEIIEQAITNAQLGSVGDRIQFSQKQLSEVEAPADTGVIICNPPYGNRIGEEQELAALYKLLGDIFKQRFKGWTAYILTGNKELAKKVGLKASKRIPVYNGSLPCTLLKYELY